ncbi:MAG: preprotein translocase subunit SecG [Bacteroidales bacterium]|nr:preprotein translocase subunit SecG [Bacteroidales bacterium]
MFILFTVLIVVVCILTILIVLVQNSKGGGLAANFSSSNQIMGVRRTTDFLEKATWTLGTALIVFSLLAGITIPSSSEVEEPRLQGQFDESVMDNPGSQPLTLPESFGDEGSGSDGEQ